MANTIIFIISVTILLSYVVEIFAKQLKIPSVLVLLVSGVIARMVTNGMHLSNEQLFKFMPVLGTIGLVLIVFEGGLELDYDAQKKKLILKSFSIAICNFLAVSGVMSIVIYLLSASDARVSMINAIPMAVVSSAIAIPAAKFLSGEKKEFLTYESVFSDIIGVLALGYMLEYEAFSYGLIGSILLEILAIIALTIVFCGIMILVLKKSTHKLKHILILSSLLMTYAVGKMLHLPILILALVFGVVLKNFHLLKFDLWEKYFNYPSFKHDVESLESMTQESVFIVKTFFFILLGYMIDIYTLLSFVHIGMVVFILSVVFAVRWVTLRLSWGKSIHDLLFLSPRGLISVLLFLSIPSSLNLPLVNLELLLLLILLNSMVLPLAFSKTKTLPSHLM